MPGRVAVILVNYREYAEEHLRECYESLVVQSYPRSRWMLFVVDNASTAATRHVIERLAPGAELVAQQDNLGWAGGNNVAIRRALQEGYDYVVLLNMDTVVEVHWLERLVEEADGRPDVQILQSKLLLYGTARVNSLGNRIQYLGYGYCHGYGQADGQPGLREPEFASGATMLVKRAVFERIGLFRDEYFLYGEDLEFCWRARLAGFRVGLAERSVCYHKYDFRKIQRALYYVERNRLTTLLTLERLSTIAVIFPCLALYGVGTLVYFTCRGWGRIPPQLLRYFLRPATWRTVIARRREIGRLRTVPDAAIVKRFSGRIVFAEIDHWAFRYLINPLLWAYWAIVRWLIVW